MTFANPARAGAAEPICDWLDGLGAAAQARLVDDSDAHRLANRALVARPDGAAAARSRLELGLTLRGAAGVPERASSLRAALADASPIVRGAVLAALGDALLDAGDPQGAHEAFRGAIAEGSPAVAERARWRAAAALHAAGRRAEAVAAWRPLLGDATASNLDPATRLAYALDLREAGDGRRAAEILRALWAAQPERPEAAEAEAALSRLRSSDDRILPFSAEERIARAFRLVAVGRAAAAGEELRAAAAITPPASPGALSLAQAAVLLASGRPGDAAREVEPHARDAQPGVRRGVQLVLARAAARERRIPAAIAAWKAVAASAAPIPGMPAAAQATLRDDAEFLAAWLHLEGGDFSGAATALERLARDRPGSRRADDARWFAAWALLRAGATARADAALRRLEQGPSAPRVRYWRASIAADPEGRISLLRSVAAEEPLGFYGVLACARLRAERLPCAPPPLAAGLPPPAIEELPEGAQLRAAAALAAAGLREEAIAELESLTRGAGGRRAAPLAAELAAFLGDPLLPFRLSRDQLGLSRRTLAWSYPAAWPALVEPAARAGGLDPALVRAVMRRESGFRPTARSSAGAVGLLQIVPGTASRLATLLRLPESVAERLEQPEVSVPLGAGYLSLLLERFGEPLLAVAAYNAGPGVVARWTRDRAGVPLDVWVESIPFRETRQYVRAVVENWAGSRAAAGEPPPDVDPDRPVPAASTGVSF